MTVRQIKTSNTLKEIKALLRGIENIDQKRGFLNRIQVAQARLSLLPEKNYLKMIKTEIRPVDEDLYKELKKVANIRAFKRLTKCQVSNTMENGIIALKDLIFSDKFRESLDKRFLRDVNRRIIQEEKYPAQIEKWEKTFQKWESSDQTRAAPDPPSEPKPLLENLTSLEWLVQSLEENGIKLRDSFKEQFLEGNIPDDLEEPALENLNFCFNIDMERLEERFPNVATKVHTDDLRRRRKPRKTRKK